MIWFVKVRPLSSFWAHVKAYKQTWCGSYVKVSPSTIFFAAGCLLDNFEALFIGPSSLLSDIFFFYPKNRGFPTLGFVYLSPVYSCPASNRPVFPCHVFPAHVIHFTVFQAIYFLVLYFLVLCICVFYFIVLWFLVQ